MSDMNSDELIPTTGEVIQQCSLILNDEDFRRSKKLSRFLEFIVEHTLSNNSHYLKAYTIAIEVFDKDELFDPQIDPLVRVNAMRLRRMLRNYYHKSLGDNVLIHVPKGCYVPHFSYRHQQQNTNLNHAKLLPKACSFPSVAVLYFKNITHNQQYTYLADGFTQELLAEFTKFKSITFIATNPQDDDVNVNGQSVRQSSHEDAQYVVSGSLLVLDKKLKVYAEVIDSISQTLIWSKTYLSDMCVEEIISTKNEIAMSIATIVAQPYGLIVRNQFAEMSKKSTDDYNAYELSLQYYQWMQTLSVDDHHQAYVAMTKALQLDPNFSDAWASLAILYVAEYMFTYKSIDITGDIRDLALDAAKQALKSDPENSRAHYALFYVNVAKYGVRAYLDQAEKAYQLNKNNTFILADYGMRTAICGNWDKGIELIHMAMTLNPAHPDFYYGPFVMNSIRREQYTEALKYAKMINMPGYFWAYLHLIVAYSKLKDQHNAMESAHNLLKIYPDIEQHIEDEFKKWDVDLTVAEIYLKEIRKTMAMIAI